MQVTQLTEYRVTWVSACVSAYMLACKCSRGRGREQPQFHLVFQTASHTGLEHLSGVDCLASGP